MVTPHNPMQSVDISYYFNNRGMRSRRPATLQEPKKNEWQVSLWPRPTRHVSEEPKGNFLWGGQVYHSSPATEHKVHGKVTGLLQDFGVHDSIHTGSPSIVGKGMESKWPREDNLMT